MSHAWIVVDLEATCDNKGRVPRNQMETIEIGAVRLNGKTLAVIDEFAAFVRPVRHPQLTAFCTQLTSITQQQVDEAASFPDVMAEFKKWIWSDGDAVFCSWGDYDRKQLDQDCAFHGIPNPMPGQHRNLKKQFSERLGLPKKLGMAGALKQVGLELEGTHHRGIDDARNIARLLPYCLDLPASDESS